MQRFKNMENIRKIYKTPEDSIMKFFYLTNLKLFLTVMTVKKE